MAKQDYLARAGYIGPAYLDADGHTIEVVKGDTLNLEPDHTLVQARIAYNPKHESTAGVQTPAGLQARRARQAKIQKTQAAKAEPATAG